MSDVVSWVGLFFLGSAVVNGGRVSSTMCSKHVEAYNKLIIKQNFVH